MKRLLTLAPNLTSEPDRNGDRNCQVLPAAARQYADEPPGARRRLLVGMSAFGAMVLTGCGGSTSASTPALPALTMDSNPAGLVNGPVTVKFRFGDAVAAFGTDRFLVTGGTVVAGSFTRITASEYSVQIAPPASQMGTIRMEVFPFDIKDATGAIGRPTLYWFAQPYDTVAWEVPDEWATFSDSVGDALWTGGPLVLTITLKAIKNAQDVTEEILRTALIGQITGATMSDLARVSDKVYTLKLTPMAGATRVAVQLNSWILGLDSSGPPRGIPVRWARSVPDNWVTIRDSLGDTPWTGEPLVLTITFNVPISKNLTQEALSASGPATLSEFTRVSDRVYTVKVTRVEPAYQVGVLLEPEAVGVEPLASTAFSWQRAGWWKQKWPG